MEIKCMEIKNDYSAQTWTAGTAKRISRINHSRKRRAKSVMTRVALKGIGAGFIVASFLIPPMAGNIAMNVLYGVCGVGLMFL